MDKLYRRAVESYLAAIELMHQVRIVTLSDIRLELLEMSDLKGIR